MKDKIKGNNYVYWGVTAFIVIAASIVLVFVLANLQGIFGALEKLLVILTPILLGLMFAYLLNPLVVLVEKLLDKLIKLIEKKTSKKIKKKVSVVRGIAIFITYVLTLLLIALVLKFFLPSLLDSLNMMLNNIPMYINNVYDYLKDILKSNPDLMELVDKWNSNITEALGKIMIPSFDAIFSNITVGLSSFISWIINIIIGLIVSVYLIYDKDQFINGTKKVLKALLPKKLYDTTITTLGYIDKVFGGFMVAKIIDSLLIGVLTFIITSIFKIPYALIISVIVGVTNIIPYFGPFIGAIPCIAFLLLIDPKKSLSFAILILLIQQFDGNILGPKLIGNKTGIKSFWVLFSILLFGGLFGFAGMIFGVPVFAVIYSVLQNLINKRLDKKKNA